METEKLNLIPNGFKQTCYCSQGDDGRVIRFELLEGISPYILDGSEVITNSVKKPNGDTIINSVPNTEQAYIDVTISADITELAGVAEGEVTITKAGAVIGTQNYILEIEADAYGADVEQRTATGIIATFTTNIIDTLEIEADIEPKQDLNGYSSPFIDSDEVNRVPYLKRAVNGTASRIGNKLYDKLVGGTVAFNQKIGYQDQNISTNGITISFNALTGKLTVTVNNPTGYAQISFTNSNMPQGHKILLASNTALANGMELYCFNIYVKGSYEAPRNKQTIGITNNSANVYFYVPQTVANGTYEYYLTAYDLTQMLGATVADYIYGLEQATAGAGVAFFKALGFDKDYYPYNAGELMSVKATAHILRDASDNIIGNYALDSNLELRGLLKLDENNSPYYDGDTYEASGAVTRRFAKYSFTGGETWELYNNEPKFWYSSPLTDSGKTGTNNIITNGLRATITNNNQIRLYLNINPQITEASNLNNILSNGNDIVYELAESTTEQATAFTNPQNVIAGGYEEYSDSRAVPIPVGHETYHANICEISGATECNIVRAGANIWDEEWELGIWNSNGAKQASSNAIRSQNYISVLPNTNYYIYTVNKLVFRLLDKNKAFISTQVIYSAGVLEIPSNCYYIVFCTFEDDRITVYNNNISINYPASDTDYHSGSCAEIVIDLNGTIYGGKVNNKGLLTVNSKRSKLRDLTWYYVSSIGIFNTPTLADEVKGGNIGVISECYPLLDVPLSTASITANNNFIRFNLKEDGTAETGSASVGALVLKASAFTTINELLNAIGDYYVIYPLKDPFEVQLTGAELESLLGVNNVMASTGAVKVNYLYRATDEA